MMMMHYLKHCTVNWVSKSSLCMINKLSVPVFAPPSIWHCLVYLSISLPLYACHCFCLFLSVCPLPLVHTFFFSLSQSQGAMRRGVGAHCSLKNICGGGGGLRRHPSPMNRIFQRKKREEENG